MTSYHKHAHPMPTCERFVSPDNSIVRLHLLAQQPAEPRGAPADQHVLRCEAADARAPEQGDERAPPRVLRSERRVRGSSMVYAFQPDNIGFDCLRVNDDVPAWHSAAFGHSGGGGASHGFAISQLM